MRLNCAADVGHRDRRRLPPPVETPDGLPSRPRPPRRSISASTGTLSSTRARRCRPMHRDQLAWAAAVAALSAAGHIRRGHRRAGRVGDDRRDRRRGPRRPRPPLGGRLDLAETCRGDGPCRGRRRWEYRPGASGGSRWHTDRLAVCAGGPGRPMGAVRRAVRAAGRSGCRLSRYPGRPCARCPGIPASPRSTLRRSSSAVEQLSPALSMSEGSPMRIAMVSEHASPLAARRRRRRRPERACRRTRHAPWPRGATTSSSTPGETRPTCRGAWPMRRSVVVEHLDAGPPRPRPKGRTAALHAGVSAALAAAPAGRAARRRARPLLDERPGRSRGRGRTAAPRRADVPRARRGQAPPPGRGGHQPAGRIGCETRAGAAAATGSSPPAPTRSASCCDWVRPRDRVDIVPCGVDLDRLHAPTGRGRAAGAAPAAGRRRLVPRKGVDDAIRAAGRDPGHRTGRSRAVRTAARSTHDPEVAPAARARRRARRGRPGALRRPGRPRPAARADPVGRRCALPALVRAVRDRPARGDGVRRAGRRSAVGGLLDTVVDGVTGAARPAARPAPLRRRGAAALLADDARRRRLAAAARRRVAALHLGRDRRGGTRRSLRAHGRRSRRPCRPRR